ncbi:cyclase [candidate division KSB3 bacterium]|uniref:Cyclase n=1 Tax=candidate division KSB3 bacterium TaxID=2044937 RepID=A0A2G6KG80_9BACT|nr:MAG: cyclase [candidate division KSB3 bacterium]
MNLMQSVTIVDLSVTLAEPFPCSWPGHMPFAQSHWVQFTKQVPGTPATQLVSPYQTNYLIMDEHCGTHFDASVHFIPPEDSGLPFAGPLGNNTGENVGLKDLIGPAAVIDVRFLCHSEETPGVSPMITREHIISWESQHGTIQDKDIVLFHTGWDVHYKAGNEGHRYAQGPLISRDTPGWPAPEVDTVIYLYEKGVKTIGIDSPSLGATHNGVPVHQEGLRRGLIYIEGLAHLDQIPSRGAQFLFLPLKIAGATGCPGRAIAMLPQGEG